MEQVAESGIAAHWQYKSGQQGRVGIAGARQGVAEQADGGPGRRQPGGVPGKRPCGPVSGQGLRVYAQGRHSAPAARRDLRRLCLCGSHRRRQPLRRCPGRPDGPSRSRTPLKNGQTIQVITSKSAKPNPAWMNFVATAKARTAIRNYLKKLRRGKAADLGRKLLDNALKEYSLSVRKVPDESMQRALAQLGLQGAHGSYSKRSGSASAWRR